MRFIWTIVFIISIIAAGYGQPGGWQLQLSGHYGNFQTIQFLDSRNGWAVGHLYNSFGDAYEAIPMRSRDGGITWEYAGSHPPDLLEVHSAYFSAPESGWIAGRQGFDLDIGQILYTSDGGANWQMVLENSGGAFVDIAFANSQSGWLNATDRQLFSEDGGQSWAFLDSTRYWDPNSAMFFVDDNSGWAVNVAAIYHTFDGGINWEVQSYPDPLVILNDIYFIDFLRGWIVGNNGTILRTTNSGLSWQRQNSGTTRHLYACVFSDINHGWAAGEGGMMLFSDDAGNTWQQQPTPTDQNLNALFYQDGAHLWAAGDSGTILFSENGGIVSISNTWPQLPEGFLLEQNYPNPFNPETHIRYQISDIRYQNANSRLLNLTVFDIQGRKIRTLVNQIQLPGNYSVSWDGRDDAGEAVTSGVYLYRLTAGQFSESHKMLLVR